eukprot:evm.model.NODE_10827_length_17461_cov_27.031786.3
MPKRAADADLVQPKGAMNAYMHFATDPNIKERAMIELPTGAAIKDITSKCGQMWREMSEEEKKPWTARAEADKARHAKEMEVFVKAGGMKKARKSKKSKATSAKSSTKGYGGKGGKGKGKGKEKVTAVATPAKKEKKERAARDPTKPVAPGSAFDLYVKGEYESENRKEEMKEMLKKDIRALMRKEWDEMDEEEHKVWKDAAKAASEEYKI